MGFCTMIVYTDFELKTSVCVGDGEEVIFICMRYISYANDDDVSWSKLMDSGPAAKLDFILTCCMYCTYNTYNKLHTIHTVIVSHNHTTTQPHNYIYMYCTVHSKSL